MGAFDRVVDIGVRNSLLNRSHHGNRVPPDNSVANCDSMLAPVGSGDPGDRDPVQGGNHHFGEADHPPKGVQRLYSVVVVAHLVAINRSMLRIFVLEPS